MGIYRDLGRSPGVFRIIAAQLLARFPFGMLSITVLLHIELSYGNFTSAGVILAAQSIGQAISGPIASRLMGRLGMRPVLLVTSVVCTALLVTIALTHLPLIVVTLIAFVLGLTTPPVTPAVRTLYPTMVPGNRLTALFSLDASAQEIIWIIGPVVAVFVSTQISTVWGLLLAAAFMLGGGLWFALSPEVGRVQVPAARRHLGAVLRRPTVLISTVLTFFFVGAFAAIEAGIVAAFGHGGLEAGIVLAVFSAGSIVGGVILGHRDVRPFSPLWFTLIVFVGTALCLVSQNPVWLSVVLFFGGMGTAPFFAATLSIVSSTVKFSETAEAYGWVSTGMLVGVALGSASAGIAIDLLGATGGILVSVLMLAVTSVFAVASARWIPDLRGRDASPMLDTGTVRLPRD